MGSIRASTGFERGLFVEQAPGPSGGADTTEPFFVGQGRSGLVKATVVQGIERPLHLSHFAETRCNGEGWRGGVDPQAAYHPRKVALASRRPMPTDPTRSVMSATVSLTNATPPLTGAGSPPTAEAWTAAFDVALPYEAFLDRHATPDQRLRWNAFHGRVSVTANQSALLASFTRRMPVLVLAGAWCGDCVNQVPIFAHFAAASPTIDLRLLDRDALPEIAAHLKVCGGQRVPVAAFFSEDFTPVHFYGDRTLSAYRASAEKLVAGCPTGIVPPPADATSAVISDWLDQFERVHHILRLSARLREKHND